MSHKKGQLKSRIPQKDIKLLWGRSGSRCAICRIELSNDCASSNESYLLGEQCHIIGESKDAPRGLSPLSLEERNTYHNLILLCPTHHTEIDKNVKDWPPERLFTRKSTHELWVRSLLSTEEDSRKEADNLIVSSAIDSITVLLKLDTWSGWTSFALATEPKWADGLYEEILTATAVSNRTIWPLKFDELRRATSALTKSTLQAAEHFFEHADLSGGYWRTIKFYKSNGWNPNYSSDLAEYTKWLKTCYSLIYEATKAANWFADVVRRDINPFYFAEKGRFAAEYGPDRDRHTVLVFTEEEKEAFK